MKQFNTQDTLYLISLVANITKFILWKKLWIMGDLYTRQLLPFIFGPKMTKVGKRAWLGIETIKHHT